MSLVNISICLSDLPKEKIKKANNGKVYINLCVASRKEVSEFGETHTVFVSQTKGEREGGNKIVFVGGGKEFVPQSVSAESVENMPVAGVDDLPF